MPDQIHAGLVLASRYRLEDLLAEEDGGLFWRAHDRLLHRPVAVHLLPADDDRAPRLREAARRSAGLADRRLLRVLDTDEHDGMTYVVNEWGKGTSLDILLATDGPLPARQAAWLVSEVADSIAAAHDAGLSHGRLVPENVLIDEGGQVRIIGFAVDAALHGLPPGRRSSDVVDLAGLLYAALTGRWGGMSASEVPPAPADHESVLRPRKVRAGIPRMLDSLCDEVINPFTAAQPHRNHHDLTRARGIADALADYVGDPTGMAIERNAATTVLPTLPPVTGAHTETHTWPQPPPAPPAEDPTPTVQGGVPETPSSPEPYDRPTEAGMPIFDDVTDDVGWMRARAEKPAPPPPFEEPPERPLFAPDPPDGQPVRRPRPGTSPSTGSQEFWPWDSSTGTGTSYPVSGDTGAIEGDEVPGRNWFRLAMVIGLSVLVLVAAVAAYQLGGGIGGGNELPAEQESASQEPAPPEPFTDISAEDFDPQGDPPQDEYPELVPRVLDDDPSTAWHTSTYFQDFGPSGLKTGVGLILDLGEAKDVREVDVSVAGETSVAVYVTAERPESVDDLEPAGEGTAADTIEVRPQQPVSGRYVTVWLTSLPQVDGGFRGEVSGVVVRG